MATDWVTLFKQRSVREYNALEILAFQLDDADISPLDLTVPSTPHINITFTPADLAVLTHSVMDEVEAQMASELAAALIQRVK